jgi:hypothetical protein
MKAKIASLILILMTAGVLVFSCGRPGDSTDGSSDQVAANGSDPQNYVAVNGYAGFGSQCPYGSVSGITPVQLGMYDCPIKLSQIDLAQNIEPLYISADCKNKVISARTADRRIDTNWNALPDKSFFFTITGLTAKLNSDGIGGHLGGCETPLSIDISGTMQCDDTNPNRDQANIQFDVVMWTGKGSPPSQHTPSTPASPIPLPSPTPTPSPSTASSPNPHPFPWPFPWPGSHPTPTPTSNPTPAPTHSWWFFTGDSTAIQCSLPKSCYMYTESTIQQCH